MTIDAAPLQAAVRAVFDESPYSSGTISVAVVDGPTIHAINRQYLQHDYPTDVLSFVLEDREPYLEGELIVSTDAASQHASEYDWSAHNELLLYVIHGALHLVGFRDQQPEEIVAMRAAEAEHLRRLNIALPDGATRWSNDTATQKSSSEVLPS
ncbi:MAG: rRNA maturation RNase YbeY [Planctomycetes bacterium]|nr:rRNA maturation RNase YbeY [Planctomycetota bacterium]